LNAALPAETDGLEAGILAMAKVLDTWLARLNKTGRCAFRDLGDDAKVKEYRFHHLSRGARMCAADRV
jgi:hypothetical protein